MRPENYLGVDIDETFFALARERHPLHRFSGQVPSDTHYDTVASLAVIEHVPDPAAYLKDLSRLLRRRRPRRLESAAPPQESVYEAGAKLRLFSARASEGTCDYLAMSI